MNTKTYPILPQLLERVRSCEFCKEHLPLGCRPVLQVSKEARILIIGQAPGARVHASGVPWDDASGSRLRDWLGVDRTTFYDESQIAIIPMGYCYPGRGPSGDLPPRKECSELWLDQLLAALPNVELTLLIGLYAQRHFLKNLNKSSLTETVMHWQDFAPHFIPLPHPSPRNTPWLKRNAWFERDLLPLLSGRIHALVAENVSAVNDELASFKPLSTA